MKNNKEELVKLIQENPNLPLVFMVSSDEVTCDYCYTVMKKFRAYKSEIYEYEKFGDLVFSDDEDEVIEYYAEDLSDEQEYKDLSDEEFDKAVEEYVEKEIEHYEAIIVYVN